MTFLQDETGVATAEPVELYEFVGNVRTYRLTSNHEDFSFGGNTYLASTISRSEVTGDGQGTGETALLVVVAADSDIAQDQLSQAADQLLDLTVTRVHRSTLNFAVIWKGRLTSTSLRGNQATLRVPSVLAGALQARIPPQGYQAHCNHVLYDARCTIVEATFTTATTISSIGGSGREVTLASDGGNPDQFFRGGVATHTATGDKRLVLDHTGDVITLQAAFSDASPTDAISVTAGCDRTLDTCRAKFSNEVNFGGYPFIPILDVFNNPRGLKGIGG